MDSPDEAIVASDADRVASSRVSYHEASGAYRTEFDRQSRTVTEAVVTAVARATGTDELELPALGSVLDCDALRALFAGPLKGPPRGPGSVTFEYAGLAVTVESHGTVVVESPDADGQ